jgi:hypothetical protein
MGNILDEVDEDLNSEYEIPDDEDECELQLDQGYFKDSKNNHLQ